MIGAELVNDVCLPDNACGSKIGIKRYKIGLTPNHIMKYILLHESIIFVLFFR